jgi:hypothetical protein
MSSTAIDDLRRPALAPVPYLEVPRAPAILAATTILAGSSFRQIHGIGKLASIPPEPSTAIVDFSFEIGQV